MRLTCFIVLGLCANSFVFGQNWHQGSGPSGSYAADGAAVAQWSVVHEKLADSMHRFHEAISSLLKSKKFKDLLASETAVEEGI